MTKIKCIRFGFAGNPINFFKSEFRKDRLGAPAWCRHIGLNATERQMTYGARMKEEDAVRFGKIAKKNDVELSVHGPYYVVLTSEKKKVVAGRAVTDRSPLCLSLMPGRGVPSSAAPQSNHKAFILILYIKNS